MQKKTLTLKNNLESISIDVFKENLPDLKNIKEAKAVVIGKWLARLINDGICKKKFKNGQLLPSKAEFAYHLGVSIGTIQNALKYCEDFGCLNAKPCIGTVVKSVNSEQIFNQKSNSKRNLIANEIKKYIKSQNLRAGDSIPSPKTLSEIINQPQNTIRQALEHLSTQGILKHVYRNSEGKTGWYLMGTNFDTDENISEIKTLVDKTVDELKDYISQNYRRGDKIASHAQFAKIFNTSASTIHTAFMILCKEGILKTRRGQYGTTVVRMPNDKSIVKPEMSIFAPASEAVNYYYQRVQAQIKKMISDSYEVGDRLPPITEIAKQLEISPNTVRKALLKISDEGYVKSLRGRYGGTIVMEIPEAGGQSFRWLAVNPKYALNKS